MLETTFWVLWPWDPVCEPAFLWERWNPLYWARWRYFRQKTQSQAKMQGGLCGWRRCSQINSNKKKKRKHTEDVSKDGNTETLFEHPRMKFGKLKPWRNWAWLGMSRRLRRASVSILATKGKVGENMSLLLDETEYLVTQDSEKATILNAFFASVFTSKTGLQQSQSP